MNSSQQKNGRRTQEGARSGCAALLETVKKAILGHAGIIKDVYTLKPGNASTQHYVCVSTEPHNKGSKTETSHRRPRRPSVNRSRIPCPSLSGVLRQQQKWANKAALDVSRDYTWRSEEKKCNTVSYLLLRRALRGLLTGEPLRGEGRSGGGLGVLKLLLLFNHMKETTQGRGAR